LPVPWEIEPLDFPDFAANGLFSRYFTPLIWIIFIDDCRVHPRRS